MKACLQGVLGARAAQPHAVAVAHQRGAVAPDEHLEGVVTAGRGELGQASVGRGTQQHRLAHAAHNGHRAGPAPVAVVPPPPSVDPADIHSPSEGLSNPCFLRVQIQRLLRGRRMRRGALRRGAGRASPPSCGRGPRAVSDGRRSSPRGGRRAREARPGSAAPRISHASLTGRSPGARGHPPSRAPPRAHRPARRGRAGPGRALRCRSPRRRGAAARPPPRATTARCRARGS